MATENNFFQQVYTLVSRIPAGKVATYGQIAILLGHPRAARTVGWALHGLPHGTDVPWQRVINSKGRISNYASALQLNLQKILLEQEGVQFDDDDGLDLVKYQHKF